MACPLSEKKRHFFYTKYKIIVAKFDIIPNTNTKSNFDKQWWYFRIILNIDTFTLPNGRLPFMDDNDKFQLLVIF